MAEIRFVPVEFPDVSEVVRRHWGALPSRIDSFLEDHILGSSHLRFEVSGKSAGFASIYNGSLITQFSLADDFKRHGQLVFAQLRRLENVQSAFVPTCDEFFLAHALDDYRQLTKQAHFFAVSDELNQPIAAENYCRRAACARDIEFIKAETGDFFDDLERHIDAGEIFLTSRQGETAGFGIMERSSIFTDVASIGMFTIERFRRVGVGAATIAMLIDECRRRGIEPIAGCWYYNHLSKRTLERAGMYSATRLLKIDY